AEGAAPAGAAALPRPVGIRGGGSLRMNRLADVRDTDDRLAELLDELTGRLHAGEALDADAVAAAYPDLAAELRRLLPAPAALERANGLPSPLGGEGPGVRGPDGHRLSPSFPSSAWERLLGEAPLRGHPHGAASVCEAELRRTGVPKQSLGTRE